MLALLAGCATFPEVEAVESADVDTADYPRLVNIDTLIARTAPRATPDLRAGVEARAAGLRARADALRGPIIDDATRARMDAGVDGAG
ncbi:hypothetical protein SAMN04515678_11340 [Roseivivax sediminis]|uniref:Uncharacterized protein n=1 Tax=Roseivivax sediminis TaxID=936889 RepID=A0A1I2CBT7_9RHOB|nr:hypothetical protein SAMN04515678_11340 [Roseivivax sediminis]